MKNRLNESSNKMIVKFPYFEYHPDVPLRIPERSESREEFERMRKLLATEIVNISGLSTRAFNALNDDPDINTLRDLVGYPEKYLLRVRKIGKVVVSEVVEVLRNYGLELGMAVHRYDVDFKDVLEERPMLGWYLIPKNIKNDAVFSTNYSTFKLSPWHYRATDVLKKSKPFAVFFTDKKPLMTAAVVLYASIVFGTMTGDDSLKAFHIEGLETESIYTFSGIISIHSLYPYGCVEVGVLYPHPR